MTNESLLRHFQKRGIPIEAVWVNQQGHYLSFRQLAWQTTTLQHASEILQYIEANQQMATITQNSKGYLVKTNIITTF